MGKRVVWADSLKGILIVLVVLGHAIQEVIKQGCFDNHLWNIIYSFHMPAFMAISGFVNYHRERVNNRISIIYRRFQQLLVPFFLWGIIRILVNPPFGPRTFINAILYPDGSFWFLWVLFFISVIFIFGDWLSEYLKQEYVIVFLCLVLSAMMVVLEIRIIGFQFIAYYFLFYTMGYYLHKYDCIISRNSYLLYALTIVWFVMAWFWNMHKLPIFLSSISLPHSLLIYSYRFLTASVAIYVLFGLFSKANNNKTWNTPMYNLGRVSLGIYTSHIILIPFVVQGLYLFVNGAPFIIFLTFFVALVVSYFLVWQLSKWRVTARVLLGKI